MEQLIKLTQLFGVSGYEAPTAEYILNIAKKHTDSAEIDTLGNVIAIKKGTASKQKIMLIASIDQKGFITTVKQDNVWRFGGIGNYIPASLVRERVESENGAIGIIGSDADKDIKIKNLYIDVIEGDATTGSVFTRSDKTYINDKYITSGRLSARVGAYVLLKVMEQLKGNKNDVIFVFATHSNLAYRGSKTATFALEPDMAITVGTVRATDVPGGDKNNITLDGGPAIKIKDKSILAHPFIKKALTTVKGIKYQLEISDETSEGGAVHLAKGPVMTGGISIPLRYKGSENEICHIGTIENTIKMILGSDLI